MNTVQRTKGIRRIIRTTILGKPMQKHVTAGDRACRRMMREARHQRTQSGPSDTAIMAWARFDLSRELLGGYWELKTAQIRSAGPQAQPAPLM